MNQETVSAGIKAVKTRKARYALFRVVNDPNGQLEITLDKQADRKATKEESDTHSGQQTATDRTAAAN